jgi:mannose-6-phosphate isomerase-like protein (cupin superfamily)
MVVKVNETSVAAQAMNVGVARQRLLTPERVDNIDVLLDRLTLAPGASARFEPSAKSLVWLHLLAGEARLETLYYRDRLSDTHSAVLPPGFPATISTDNGVSLLYAEIPDAGRLDKGFSATPPLFTVINWRREPVFKSKSDGRMRVALVSPELCQTAAIKIQMMIYPPGSTAPSYHHEGAASFMYILSGRGEAWANGQRLPIEPGDVVYFPARERHHLKAANDSQLRFLVFYAPGEFKTIWADPSKASGWVSTERDINGYETAEDERERRAFSRGGGGFII